MTDKSEYVSLVAIAYDKVKLEAWYDEQKIEPYRDEMGWLRSFKPDSPLHWHNPIEWSSYGGVSDEWVEQENINLAVNRGVVLIE